MTMGTIGNVLGASQASRKPAAISIYGTAWNDSVALLQLNLQGYGNPINGDCVSVWSQSFSETKWYQDGKWLAIDDYIQPESELCGCCGGLGAKQIPFIKGLITCPDCGGTGKGKEIATKPKEEKQRPGLGDEIKPELMNKKLRDWG